MTGIVDISIPSFSWISFSRTTFEPAWHTLSGFTEDDIKSLLQTVCERLPEDDPRRYLLSQEHVVNDPEQQKDDPRQWLNDKRTALERLRDAYNGYWFGRTHDAQPAKMYNADMVLYFVRFVLSRGRFPEKGELIDPDANISDKILKFAGSLPWLGGLLVAPLTEKLITFRSPAATVDMEDIMILFKNPSTPRLVTSFGSFSTTAAPSQPRKSNMTFINGTFLLSMSPIRSRSMNTCRQFGRALISRMKLSLLA